MKVNAISRVFLFLPFYANLLALVFASCNLMTQSEIEPDEKSNSASLTITGIPDTLNCDGNRLRVILPYVVAGGSIDSLMEWLSYTDEPEIQAGQVTAHFDSKEFSRRILLVAPRGDDINNWTFWIYSGGENITFNIQDWGSSPSFDFSGHSTLSWDKFKMIPVGNWPEESTVTLPASVTEINLDAGSLEDKLLHIAESDVSNVLYTITVENDISANPLTLTTRGNNVFVKIKSASPASSGTVSLGYYGSLLTVKAPLTLILEDITIRGGTGNTAPLVNIENNGRVLLGRGAKITANENLETLGGGVFVKSGVLVVDGGEISENKSTKYSSGSGGGVYVDDDGRLYFKNGLLFNNTAYKGGAVMVNLGVFIMTGGEISGNNADCGGGVYLYDSSNALYAGSVSSNNVNFKKVPSSGGASGIIYGAIAPTGKSNNANTGSSVYYVWAKGYYEYHRNRTLNGYDAIDSDNRLINWDYQGDRLYNPDLTGSVPQNHVDLSGLTPKSAPGSSLEEIFAEIGRQEEEDVIYTINVLSDQYLSPQHLFTRGKNVVIRLRSQGDSIKTISLTGPGSLFYIYNHVTLILENIILRGVSNNNAPLIYNSGTLSIENGTVICENVNVTGTTGGIFVDTGGHLIMNGGEIRDNQSLDYNNGSGGGVMLYSSAYFHMNNGKIYNNFAEEEGGGVCVHQSTFIMYNGEIYNNRGFQGGGVYLNGSIFKKQISFGQTVSGRIYANTIPEGTSKPRGMFIHAYANGSNVYAGDNGANSDIDETQHMTTDNKGVAPWERL